MAARGDIRKVVLAYSGGLDTSAIVPWLVENYGCEVVCFAADVGQGADELAGIEDKARASGASSCIVRDIRRVFVDEFAFPTLMGGIVYEGRYLLGTAIARPAIARAQVEAAREVGADAVAHGCTGKGNDQVRFESAFVALAPDLAVIAPWREWDMTGRADLLRYCAEKGVRTSASAEKLYSRDRNLWHISHEGGPIENPWNPPPADVWMLTADVSAAPDEPGEVLIEYKNGRPVALDGKPLDGVALLETLNDVAGAHSVGRVDLVENRAVGMKSRGLYETPGGTVLAEGLMALEELVLDRELRMFKEELGRRFAKLVYDGRWFTPMRAALSAAAESIAHRLTGEVVVRLHKGRACAVQRRSGFSLYREDVATFEGGAIYDQRHAEGFIRLASLPERLEAFRLADGGPA